MTENSFHNIYVLGGHKLALSYFNKILDAKNSDNLAFENIFMIDHDPNCAAHVMHGDHLINTTYPEFVCDYVRNTDALHPGDILVPDHTAKHTMFAVFSQLLAESFPKKKIKPFAISWDLKTPFEHNSPDGAHKAMSYATWTCPADCSEPNICPHTESDRDWDFNTALAKIQKSESKDPAILFSRFSCSQLLEEISYIPMPTILAETSKLMHGVQNETTKIVQVATHSHCHGITSALQID